VQRAALACSHGAHGTASLRVSVYGATGRATHAEIAEPMADQALWLCIRRAAREVSLPRFRQDSFQLAFPVQY
jgi:hypothetical protein